MSVATMPVSCVAGAFLAVCVVCAGEAAAGQEQASRGNADRGPVTWRASFKFSLIGARTDSASDAPSMTSFGRVRIEPRVALGPRTSIDVAYEQRATAANGAGMRSQVLPSSLVRPFRWRQLEWSLYASNQVQWRQEVDRLSVVHEWSRARLVIGRQALGWGRGAVFGAVDWFSPFNPLEADREWRLGVDAARLEIETGARSSMEVVGVAAARRSDAAWAMRWHTFWSGADVEVMGGRRAEDLAFGVSSSAPLGPIEVHGELATFRTVTVDGAPTVIKSVAGGSYRVPVGPGLLLMGEYHYSGFGLPAEASGARAIDVDLIRRYQRGDMQIVGRHATAVMMVSDLSPSLSLTGQWLHSPRDGSGVVSPSLTWTFSDRLSTVAAVYEPYGRGGPASVREFARAQRALFLQLRAYL